MFSCSPPFSNLPYPQSAVQAAFNDHQTGDSSENDFDLGLDNVDMVSRDICHDVMDNVDMVSRDICLDDMAIMDLDIVEMVSLNISVIMLWT